ncbi:MAG: twin-arginine translocation signal domain-containing protein, partial [Phycisphaerae bacterium]|nr:twin-arginine translocation signal domain-containing protein [Phycisphaerae bacterium]
MPPLNDMAHSCGDDAPIDATPAHRVWWRSIEEKQPSPELLEQLGREFPEGASELPDGHDRRTFMKLAGASAALAGIGLAGCRRWPESKIVPYGVRPADRVPGTPVVFATAMEYGGVGVGLLATSYDGRPIRLDGNPASWSGRGTSTITQARILELYNPERSLQVRHAGKPSFDSEFTRFADPHFKALRAKGGEGLAFLTECFSGPSWADMKSRVSKAFPKATWASWEPLSNDASIEGTAAAFGPARRPVVDFSKADIVVSFDDDFLNAAPIAARSTSDFASARRRDLDRGKSASTSRLYAVESTLSVTGMNADERFAMRSVDIPAFAAWVANELAVAGGHAALGESIKALAAGFEPSKLADETRRAALSQLVNDLKTSRGRSVVTAGPRQPAAVHALCALMNDALGSAGATVRYAPALESACVPALAALVEALNAGRVDTLVIVGGNPVYDAPADLGFESAMAKAPTVVHHSLEVNETSRHPACTWHLPAAHFLECWGDVRTWDHGVALQQPLILPLVPESQGARSPIELLAFVLAEDPKDGASIVRRTHMAAASGIEAETKWRSMLELGTVPAAAASLEARPAIKPDGVAKSLGAYASSKPSSSGVELVLIADMKVWDGRFGSIGWLQELPDPVTKITWDNAALMSPVTAERFGFRKGDLVKLSSGGRDVEAAAWPLPGHALDSISLALGYGRGESSGSTIAAGAGFNAYRVRSTGAMHVLGDVAVTRSAGTYSLAHTQDHGVSEAFSPAIPHQGIQER